MMNQYETVFILTPVLSDDQMKEAVNKYQDYLNDKEPKLSIGKTGDCENWRIRSKKNPQDFTTSLNLKPMVICNCDLELASNATNALFAF